MDGPRLVIDRAFFAALAIIVAAGLFFSAGIGMAMGHDKYTPQDPPANSAENSVPNANSAENTVPPKGNTSDNTSSNSNSATNTNAADNTTPNTNSTDNTADNQNGTASPGKNIGGTGTITNPISLDPDDPSEPTPQQIAASMQDYTIDPNTGKAREIKVPDDNYLVLINRTHPLAEAYVPDDLREVNYVVSSAGAKGETNLLRNAAAAAFDDMAASAENQNIKIKMRVGYESYTYHKERIYDLYVKTRGQAYADTYSCPPGLSEHQTGLALNIAGASDSYALSENFLSTEEGRWVKDHCWQYGFILRYTDGTKDVPGAVTGFVYEPYHLRYVGIKAATEIMSKGITLEEYLGVLK